MLHIEYTLDHHFMTTEVRLEWKYDKNDHQRKSREWHFCPSDVYRESTYYYKYMMERASKIYT